MQERRHPSNPAERRDGAAALAIVLAAAVVVRLIAHLAHRSSPFAAAPILDAQLYDSWARRIAGGEWIGHDVFYANPLYPYFLAIIYRLTGGSAELARLVQHALGVGTVALVYALTRSAFDDRLAAAAAATLAALYLPFVAFGDTLLIATLGVFLLAASLLAVVRAGRRDHPTAWLAAGALGGLALLARPTLVPAAIVLWILASARRRARPGGRGARPRRRRRRLLPYAAGLLLAILPVTIRNAAVSGRFVPITAHGGETFYVGNRSGSDGSNLQPPFVRSGPRFEHEDFRREASRRLGREVDLETASRYWLRQALAFIRTEPAAYLRLELRKLDLLFHAYEKGDNLDLESRRRLIGFYRLPWPGFGLVAALGLAGIIVWWGPRLRRRPLGAGAAPAAEARGTATLLTLAILAQLASLLLVFVTARYRLPLVAVLLPFAGYLAAAGVQRWRTPRRLLLPAATAILLFAALHRPLPAGRRNDPALSAINLGYLYERQGDLEAAARSYRLAIAAAPRNALAALDLGIVERRLGQAAAARAALQRAVELDPDYAGAWNRLASVLAEIGELDAALRAAQRAVELEPRRTGFLRDLGAVHAMRGEAGEAIATWERALALDPVDRRTRDALRRLEQELERHARDRP